MAWEKWLLDNPLYFGIIFVVGWLSVTFYFARVTGWNKLAGKYASTEKPRTQLMQAVSVSWGSPMFTGNIYTLGSTERGLYLGVLFPFRFGHHPLLIPWRDIKAQRVQKLLVSKVELSFGAGLSRPVEVSEKVAKNLKVRSGGQFSF
jgi:hypothetical protein